MTAEPTMIVEGRRYRMRARCYSGPLSDLPLTAVRRASRLWLFECGPSETVAYHEETAAELMEPWPEDHGTSTNGKQAGAWRGQGAPVTTEESNETAGHRGGAQGRPGRGAAPACPVTR